jgi:hypothetical protein
MTYTLIWRNETRQALSLLRSARGVFGCTGLQQPTVAICRVEWSLHGVHRSWEKRLCPDMFTGAHPQ